LNLSSIDIRLLRAGDEALLARVAPDVFDGTLSTHWLRELLASPQQSLAVAVHEGVVVGMALAVRVLHPDKVSELWLNELAVAATHRRAGVARAMVQALMQEAAAQGCRQMLVTTEQSNQAAQALYRSLGAKPIADGFSVFLRDI
jgi:ribosomal protein S18 acetylase RimI-like enzyme